MRDQLQYFKKLLFSIKIIKDTTYIKLLYNIINSADKEVVINEFKKVIKILSEMDQVEPWLLNELIEMSSQISNDKII